MACRNCNCDDCKSDRSREDWHSTFTKYLTEATKKRKALWNVCEDLMISSTIKSFDIKEIRPFIKLTVEDFLGRPSIIPTTQVDNYVCQRCGCNKLCTQTDRSCWKCGEPVVK